MKYNNTCITPEKKFIYGIHKPSYSVTNLRQNQKLTFLGTFEDGSECFNAANFPEGDVHVEEAKWIIEVPNPFPFRGATYIDKSWADRYASDCSKIRLAKPGELSFKKFLEQHNIDNSLIHALPRPLLLTLATCSTDSGDLRQLAELSCKFVRSENGKLLGLKYQRFNDGSIRPSIDDHDLFEAVANNPALPDDYKRAMVLRPGAQGGSEIVGEWGAEANDHVYEYLRRNSYISGGHYAANMADNAVRYSISSLSPSDMNGLRHLYYQRMYVHLAALLDIPITKKSPYTVEELEELRLNILHLLDTNKCHNYATLWGWNFGFDYTPTDYRLHASHQQIHQQYAVIPDQIEAFSGDSQFPIGTIASHSCGDMITRVIDDYSSHYNSNFFQDYWEAITNNERMDNRKDLPASLIVWEDDNVAVFVPKAQTSQWELQIMAKQDGDGHFPGNILEADSSCRDSFNTAILKTQQVFERLGARMVTSIEFSKRIACRDKFNQPLLYSMLPKLPFSAGAFSEAQLRFINRHYPEDFGAACRNQL